MPAERISGTGFMANEDLGAYKSLLPFLCVLRPDFILNFQPPDKPDTDNLDSLKDNDPSPLLFRLVPSG